MDHLVRELQVIAAQIATTIAPGSTPGKIRILGEDGCVLFAVPITHDQRTEATDRVKARDAGSSLRGAKRVGVRIVEPVEDDHPTPPPKPPKGWDVSEHGATFDGRAVKVAGSRLGLLRVLAGRPTPVPVGELMDEFPAHTSEDNVRYHIKQLRKELQAAFPDAEFDPLPGTGEGFQLVIRA